MDAIKRGIKTIGKARDFGKKVLGSNAFQTGLSLIRSIPNIEEFVGQTKALIEKYSQETIKSLTSCRVPLSGAISGLVRVLHQGKISVDKFFHLFLRIGLSNGTTLMFEKEERPKMNIGAGPRQDEQTRSISVSPGLTLGTMIENAIKKVGKTNYFTYDPFTRNCQQFQIAHLSSSPQIHMTADDRKWIDQSAQEIGKGVPSWAKSASHEIIDAYGKLSSYIS